MKKMKKIFLLFIAVALIAGCKQSFLDTTDLEEKTNNDFYKTPTDMDQALTATYVTMVSQPDKDASILNAYPFVISDLMSDDRFGGGGDNDQVPRAICDFKITGPDMFWSAWKRYYTGIFRANMILENIDKPAWETTGQKGNVQGQALFLRAMFYFDLSRLFGDVPLIVEAKPMNIPRTPAAEVYAQIASDLKQAIELFPSTPYSASTYAQMGRANKWAAEALVARVFLFYTGYYETTTLPLVGGGSVAKADVITWLEDCRDNSGYHLMGSFQSLWPYSVAQSPASDSTYAYVKKNSIPAWYGEAGANYETMFALKFSTFADWGTSIYYSNQMDLFFGWRRYEYDGFMGAGWGMGTVNKSLWDSWSDSDPRKRGSILYVDDPDEGVSTLYALGTDTHDKQMDETGYWQKKYRPINVLKGGGWHNYSNDFYNAAKNFQLDNMQDIVLIRFADILLMHSELTETVAGINSVRGRVGLAPIGAYTLDALKDERRHELAFEGVRYYDLLRWAGKSNLASLETILEAKNNVPTINNGLPGVKKGVDFRPVTGGFLQIPNREILLSVGVLTQTPGWETGTAPVYSLSYK
jgi:starch-binding outer membrane protein, SusD/RagB family